MAPKDSGLVEYIYPLKTDGKATATLEEFTHQGHHQVAARRAQRLQPDARLTLERKSDKEVTVTFDRNQGLLDKDFQLFYSLGDKDVGLTALTHRPVAPKTATSCC